MKKLYLHIGMGKTGTTALQDFFWDNRTQLATSDICYPEFGIQSNAHHLLSPHIPRFLEGVWDFKSVDQWAPRLAQVAQDNILLSSELMAWGTEEEVRNYCAGAVAWFDVNVVIYLRRQDNIIMASYNQQIKAGPQKRRIDLTYRQQIERFDYLRILQPWIDALGAQKITVRPYENEQFYRGDVRRDFLHAVFGQEVDDRFTLRQENPNPRLSPACGEYKRMVNNLADDATHNDRFNELLMRYPEDRQVQGEGGSVARSVLSPRQRGEILAASRDASETIARLFLGRDNGRLFVEPEPDPATPWAGIDLSRKEIDTITEFLREQDPALVRWLERQVEAKIDHLAYQVRHSARCLSPSVAPSLPPRAIYKVGPEDGAPVVIGGLGGSGTRLVASLLRRMGVFLGGELNGSLDNLWFSLLFVRRSILLKSESEFDRLAWLFANAMRHGIEVSAEQMELLEAARNCDRSPVLPPELLAQAADSLLRTASGDRKHPHWGWKEPNSHIVLPQLDRCFPQMKYVYVVRNGLDMAFSENQNQVRYLWGDLLLEDPSAPGPERSLKYWIAAHRRMQGFQERMGGRLHFLNFDRLCREPEAELELLREFAGIQISRKEVAELAATVRVPGSSGRFRQHDLSRFDRADIAFVRDMGFDIE
ncbi:sulfotransferase [Haliea sp. E17]|uniref:sulfotransferase n=1 Tax=Haliea sp. E17 TaxID=3401576 RepID=UPI003AAA653F